MDVAVPHGTADLATFRDAPDKPICALHADLAENLAGTPNGGSARGYQEPFASFGCMAVLVTARRSVGQAVYLYIAVPRANIRFCRREDEGSATVGRVG